MSYLYFSRVKISNGEEGIIIFRQGELNNPICILCKDEMSRLIKEWKEVKE
jgi:hypothetical protein